MHKRPFAKESFCGIFMNFRKPMLRRLYTSIDRNEFPKDAGRYETSVIKLPKAPAVESLSISLFPFFDTSFIPSKEIMELKLFAGTYTLLQFDDRFYPILFDFAHPWKIDILDFLNENYMRQLTIKEIAAFTGRSLSTFKRDFKKISPVSVRKWIARKRCGESDPGYRENV